MTHLLTAAQMRSVEQAAIESGAVTGLELMERAGAGVVAAVFAEWPDLARGTHRAVVLCGPGNNGGDGFVVARLLKDAGWVVEVFLYGDADKLPADARTNYERLGLPTKPVAELGDRLKWPEFDADDPDIDVFVDAAFGTGLSKSLPSVLLPVAFALNDGEEPKRGKGWRVAIDIPSGICADSGRVLGADPHGVLFADLTVSFHLPKLGHYMGDGPEASGKVVFASIGLEGSAAQTLRGASPPDRAPPFSERANFGSKAVRLVEKPTDLAKQPGNKFDHGHALILSGGPGRTGAARLAARAALRIGAGLVTVGVPPAAQMEVAGHITALMLTRVRDADALNAVLADDRINALCIGPGLGLTDHAGALVDTVLDAGHLRLARRVVFDADALTLIARDTARMEALNEHAVLTPHGGEFARLFPDVADRLTAVPDRGPAYSKVDATRDAAACCGAVVVFKGPDTVIAHPDGRVSVHAAAYDREAPWLATAGTGDVLAGFITGLLARGFDPMAAAETATWLHVECARAFGPGLIAEDLPETLPRVLRNHGA